MKHIRGSLVFGIAKEYKHLDLHHKGGLVKSTVNHPCTGKIGSYECWNSDILIWNIP